MNINRHNCEAAFLDYYEKNLSPVEVAEVLFFLEENPDLKEVFENYEAVYLEHEKINFPNKEALRKKYSSEEIEIILSSEISRANCDQFFIASSEAVLSEKQIKKLNLFLEQNPESRKEFELFQKCKLSADKISCENKESLKRKLITKENREEYFIRSVENDLTRAEENELQKFLSQNIEYKKEFELFQKTILVSETISFSEKPLLKKKERTPVFISLYSQRTTYYAAAAAILFLIGLFFFFRNNGNTDKQLFADKTNSEKKIQNVVKHETNNAPIPKQEKNIQSEKKESYKSSSHNLQSVTFAKISKRKSTADTLKIKQEEKQLQPIISEDIMQEKLVAQIENPQLQMMQEENTLAQSNEGKEKFNNGNKNQDSASEKNIKTDAGEYQSLSAFLTKKARKLLGVENTNQCAASDKLGWWDLAMAAKNQIQKITGVKTLDVNKVCDGTGDKVEYIFAAGNIEISKSADK